MFLGDKIRELREARGMSQEFLARLALTSTRTIARIETNRVLPRRATLERISVALGVEPGFFHPWVAIPSKRMKRAIGRNSRVMV